MNERRMRIVQNDPAVIGWTYRQGAHTIELRKTFQVGYVLVGLDRVSSLS